MRKKIFLWSALVLLVAVLILAFENILYVQTYYILFSQISISTTVIILLSAVLGFLVGFFAMLYSVELSRDNHRENIELMDIPTPTVADTISETDKPDQDDEPLKDNNSDDFDEDDEVLG